jgi:hypothetical protein
VGFIRVRSPILFAANTSKTAVGGSFMASPISTIYLFVPAV